MRQSLGTAVFSGMIGVALSGIFLTPVFFFVLMWLGSRKQARTATVSQAAVSSGDAAHMSRIPAEVVRPPVGSVGRAEERGTSANYRP
jgi:hypothetical protein